MLNRLRPVKRAGAENNQLITLIAFGLTVVLVRVYLVLTGFPQIGNSVLHISHLLWGGLLLFIAALLPVLIANRWVYRFGALLSGIGVGLFIDEVGKFITRSNDYFFPFAAPIIYGCFMLVVLVYIQVRKPSKHNSRAELYHALDESMELIENDLDERERADLEARLRRIIAEAEYPEHAHLAEALLAVIDADTFEVAPSKPSRLRRLIERLEAIEKTVFTEPRYHLLLILGLAIAGVGLLIEVVIFLSAIFPVDALHPLVTTLLGSQHVSSPTIFTSFIVLIILTALVAVLLLVGDAFMFLNRNKIGSEIGYLGVLIALTTVNLLLYYFNQVAAVVTTVWELAVLIGLLRYRQIYLGIGADMTQLSALANSASASDSAFDT
ncbi:MAG TPA: hypothetical protein VHD90_14080 [Phototrophicaceae bacterium]|nr:hypothetical protein [Phototrophicaceae bacterium]